MRKRMKTVRGLWAGLLAAAVVLTSAAPSALTVQAEEADAVQTAEVSGGWNIRSTRLPMR